MTEAQKQHEENMYVVISELNSEKRAIENDYKRACVALAICHQMLKEKEEAFESLQERVDKALCLIDGFKNENPDVISTIDCFEIERINKAIEILKGNLSKC